MRYKFLPWHFIFVVCIVVSFFIDPKFLLSSTKRVSTSRTILPLVSRMGRTLVYWTPHKTGSSSMSVWLTRAAAMLGAPYRRSTEVYAFSNHTDWHNRAAEMVGEEPCSIVAGHIRIISVRDRLHEGTLGAVITTTRDAMNTLASKHFHRTAENIITDEDKFSRIGRHWFFYFNDLDPCEQLRYYDGEEGCENDENLLAQRARRIAERIDCVVDTDDPEEDLTAICVKMGLKNCPSAKHANKGGYSMYHKLFENKKATVVMQRVVRVTEILRDELMKRRCRFLTDGTGLSTPGLKEPKWPFVGCSNV